MSVLIFEPAVEGHRLHFVGLIANALADQKIPYTLALPPEAFESPEGKAHLGLDRGDPPHFPLQLCPPHKSQTWWWKRQFDAMLGQTRSRHVLLPTADGVAQLLGSGAIHQKIVRREVLLHALMIRGSFAYKHDSIVRRFRAELGWRMLERIPWQSLFFLDPLALQAISTRRRRKLGQFVHLMPEPIEDIVVLSIEQARRELNIPVEGRVIGCCGRLDERKGIDRLIRSFADARRQPGDRLLLLGRHDREVLDLLENQFAELVTNGTIISRNQFAEPRDFERVFCASNVVAVPYPRHAGSSGILLRAVRCGKPVLASNWGWVGWVTGKFGLGWTVDVLDSRQFSETVSQSLEQSPSFEPTTGSRQLMRFHTIENFQAHWLNSIFAVDSPQTVLPAVGWDHVEMCAGGGAPR